MARVISIALLALVVGGLASPAAAAAAAAPDRGDHGAQARCMYKSSYVPGWGAMRLNRLTVMPPTLFSVDAPGVVGWRLLIQRTYDRNTWKRIFASVIQKSTATPTEAAVLNPLSALINSPLFLPDGHGGYLSAEYRALLRFYWYGSDGSVIRAERHRVVFYDVLRDGNYLWTDTGLCYHGVLFDQ